VDKQLAVLPDGELGFSDDEVRLRLRDAIAHLVANVKSDAVNN
jgi:hypothetical protein